MKTDEPSCFFNKSHQFRADFREEINKRINCWWWAKVYSEFLTTNEYIFVNGIFYILSRTGIIFEINCLANCEENVMDLCLQEFFSLFLE